MEGGVFLGHTLARFYRSEDDFSRLHRRLKQTPCPHCKATGTLILYGRLYGYAEHGECRRWRRGRRVFCNNRKRRNNGCGHTFSVWAADTLRRLRLNARSLWDYLKLVLGPGNKAQARRASNLGLGISSAYRIWKRFQRRQSHVRTALARLCPPPPRPHARRPAEQTLAHLQAAFPHDPCPIVAFQQRLQIAFL